MSNAAIHSILARCLAEHIFLQQMIDHPHETLQAYCLKDAERCDLLAMDWMRLRHFGGFITKVQNNYLWEEFPCMRALLKFYHAEIQVFGAYSATHQHIRQQTNLGRNQKIRLFVDFLDEYLRQSEAGKYPGLRDILVHEKVQWQLRQSMQSWGLPSVPAAQEEDVCLSGPRLDSAIPALNGLLDVEEYIYDPLKITSLLTQGLFRPEDVKSYRCLGYWADATSLQLRIFELDKISGCVLALVNGCRTARAVTRRAAKQIAGGVRPSDLRPVLESGLQAGLLRAQMINKPR